MMMSVRPGNAGENKQRYQRNGRRFLRGIYDAHGEQMISQNRVSTGSASDRVRGLPTVDPTGA